MSYVKKARGLARITDLAALPVLDYGSEIKYEGSISKTGDNADWDWGMYRDQNGEWVLMEADGPGCIFNFTQHRYPTSEVPVFRFYFDNSDKPQFEIIPEQFGKKKPFIKPLSDIFIGPEDNGRGPIWVVRSFVPMEFRTHCKVTSSIKLEGADKEKGEGGWGHITYHLYDSADNIGTFSADTDLTEIARTYEKEISLKSDRVYTDAFSAKPGERKTVFAASYPATVCGIRLSLKDFLPEMLENTVISIDFDGENRVCAPIGTFFGCEYAKTPANLKTALISADFSSKDAHFSNNYPMPYFESCKIEFINNTSFTLNLETETAINTTVEYDPKNTGYFTSSAYYPKTDNTEGKNSVIADVSGFGHMAYGVISGEDIACGCEGDVRVFTDGLSSPAVESDGSESWGSYGWGFVCPPQCNPFSAYNGVPDINDTWSELRLTFTDNYPFKSRLRFELEHGCQNDGGGKHSGQIFCYMKFEPAEKFVGAFEIADTKTERIRDRFENGIHENYQTFNMRKTNEPFIIKSDIPKENRGAVIKRVSLQKQNKMTALVKVDGVEITERKWFYPDSNTFYSLLEDSFYIPEKYTSGKDNITVEIVPLSESWNECGYKLFVLEV